MKQPVPEQIAENLVIYARALRAGQPLDGGQIDAINNAAGVMRYLMKTIEDLKEVCGSSRKIIDGKNEEIKELNWTIAGLENDKKATAERLDLVKATIDDVKAKL